MKRLVSVLICTLALAACSDSTTPTPDKPIGLDGGKDIAATETIITGDAKLDGGVGDKNRDVNKLIDGQKTVDKLPLDQRPGEPCIPNGATCTANSQCCTAVC